MSPSLIGRCGGGCSGNIDSTAEVGAACGVHSVGQPAGKVLASDGANGSAWAAGGGYTPPTAHEVLDGGGSTLTGNPDLSHTDGSSLWTLTVPSIPVVKTAGIYSVACRIKQIVGLAAGEWWSFTIDGPDPPATRVPLTATSIFYAGGARLTDPPTLVAYFAAGATFTIAPIAVSAFSTYAIQVWTQRIT